LCSAEALSRNATSIPKGEGPDRPGGISKLNQDLLANKLLANLPGTDFDLIRPHLNIGAFRQGTVLADVGNEIDQVYFPLSGMISLLAVLREGKAIETSTIGSNGVFGAEVAFGLFESGIRAIVQIPMSAATITAPLFRRTAANSEAIRLVAIRYNEVLLAQARISAACNALHSIEARFCRSLLQTTKVSGSKTVTLTQEFLSEMLGVRRTSITEVASKLQAAGLINYSRGVINILDVPALRKLSCECFEILQERQAI
jgi:CRP-like cAMP-binding protein